MTARRAPAPPSNVSKINMWLNVAALLMPLIVTVLGGTYWVGTISTKITDQSKDIDIKLSPLASKVDQISQKVDLAAKDAQSKVDQLATKVDLAGTLTQAKQDALAKDFATNQAEQQTFRSSMQTWLTKLSDSQQALSAQINQERVDRLTEATKKKP